MNRHVVFRILILLVLTGAVIGIGALAFDAGVTQGLVLGTQVSAGDSAQAPHPLYLMPYGRPWVGLGGFGCFGVLMILFLLFLIFGAVRALFWRGRWGGYSTHHAMWGAPPGDGTGERAKEVPPVFHEWHRRAHAAPNDEPAKG